MADEAAGDAPTTVPRRSSRRELTSRATSSAPTVASPSNGPPAAAAALRVDSVGDEASASSSAAPTTLEQQSTRRSRRQVKSTYATHALASLSPTAASAAAHAVTNDIALHKDKKSGKAAGESTAVVATEENERITKRRRPNPNAGGGVSTVPAAVKPPTTEVQQVILVKVEFNSPHKAPQTELVATAVEPVVPTAVPAISPASPTRSSIASPAPSSANRRRRPASRQQTLLANGQTGSNAASDNNNSTNGIWSLTSALDAATPMGDADVSARTQQRKVLGKYTGRECTLLCEVILQQLKRNSMDPKALERDHSPAFIRWEKVVQKLLKTHRLAISPLDAQTLWKFLAYAEQPPAAAGSTASPVVASTDKQEQSSAGADASLDGELLPASDTEDYALSVEKINEKHKTKCKTKKTSGDAVAAAAVTQVAAITTESSHAVETPASGAAATIAGVEGKAGVGGSVLTETQAAQIEQSTNDPVTSSVVAAAAALATKQSAPAAPAPGSHFRLYPVYGLSTGIPESWQQTRPFNVKETLPLTFVADKFLKKKPGAVQPPRVTATTATTTVSAASPELGVVSATTVQAATTVVPAVDSAAQEKPPKKKRGRKTESTKSKAGGGAADSNSTTPSTTGAPGELPAKKKRAPSQKSPGKAAATPAPPRTPFVPSSTPPPQPLQPRAAFQFFCRMHEAESLAESFVAAAAVTVPGAAAATPTEGTGNAKPLKKKTYFELQELFASASLQVRNACQKLALEDLDRYNRECVRRRIWEKAMSNSPVASPAPAATSTASTSPVAQAQQQQAQQQQQAVSIPSLVVPVAITEAPGLPTNRNAPPGQASAK